MEDLIKIAIIGRPNVGKSSFFNRLAGKRSAIVSELPGMTRDRNEKIGTLLDLKFLLIDTAGVAPREDNDLSKAMNLQSLRSIQESDIVLFMIDALENNLVAEKEIAEWIRQSFKDLGETTPVILVANKSENVSSAKFEYLSLGFGDPVYTSAAHNIGFGDLYESITKHIPEERMVDTKKSEKPFVSIAISGRPNVGKSTLLNHILCDDRVITSDVSGTTRDSISIHYKFRGNIIEFIDTAGSRKNKNANSTQEKLAVLSTDATIRRAHVVVLMVDAQTPFEVRDLQIASQVISEGRALIIAINKWDLVPDNERKNLIETCHMRLGKGLSNCYKLLPISALRGQNIKTLLNEALELYALWNKTISIKDLNNWLKSVVERTPPSMVEKKCPKFSFMRQVSSRPPSFIIFGTRISILKESYIRYLSNSLRNDFGLSNIPIRIAVKYKENPYKKTVNH